MYPDFAGPARTGVSVTYSVPSRSGDLRSRTCTQPSHAPYSQSNKSKFLDRASRAFVSVGKLTQRKDPEHLPRGTVSGRKTLEKV
jgi:hypothetical protein